jgi:hypothetical protein
MADATGQVGGFPYNFSQLFWKVWQELNYQLPQETDYCFMFELMTPYNRIVVRQNNNSLVLHGVRNVLTLVEEDINNWGDKYDWQLVTSCPLQTIEEIITASNILDPMDSEGYIVCDGRSPRSAHRNFNRLKIKSPQYVAISHWKTGFSTRRIIEIVVTNEGEEFLAYYPEWKDLYQQIRDKYDALVRDIETDYAQYKDIPVQKDFVLAIKHLAYSGILFALRKEKVDSIRQSLRETSIYKLEALLNISFVELS